MGRIRFRVETNVSANDIAKGAVVELVGQHDLPGCFGRLGIFKQTGWQTLESSSVRYWCNLSDNARHRFAKLPLQLFKGGV